MRGRTRERETEGDKVGEMRKRRAEEEKKREGEGERGKAHERGENLWVLCVSVLEEIKVCL